MLVLEDVHSYYGTSHILQGVSFSVGEGKCCALLGRNGVGKTTTIHSIVGLLPPKKGSIKLGNQEIRGLPPYKISQFGMGLVPQGRRVFPSLTIKENLTMSARDGSGQKEGRFKWTLESVCELFPILQEREKNMGNELSGGQQQMLAIGRALMTNPEFLLMDEPSEGLAPIIIEQIGDIILRLKSTGLSILIVEQNIAMACRLADEILIMNKGKIVWNGTPKELMDNEEIQHRYLGV